MERKILYRILIFIMGAVLINTAGCLYFKKRLSKTYKVVKNDKQFWKQYKDQDILILGHSRALQGIITDSLKGSIKLCSNAETIIKSYYKLKTILDRSAHRPQLIILPAGYGYFGSTNPDYNNASFYWNKYIDNNELGNIVGNSIIYRWWDFKSTIAPYQEYPLKWLQSKFKKIGKQTLKTVYTKSSINERLRESRQLIQIQNKELQLDQTTGLIYLKKMLALTEDAGIKVLFIEYPVSKEYRSICAHQKHIEIMKQAHNIILKHTNIGLYDTLIGIHADFSDNLDDCPECFKDIQHLNEKGAQKLTQQLDEMLSVVVY